MAVVDVMRDHVDRAGLPPLQRYVAALAASFLADAGRVEEAEQVWDEENRPEDAHGCLDLDGRCWREMEVLSCVRIRILGARGATGEARDLAGLLVTVSAKRGLRRSAMRGLALEITLAQRCGDAAEVRDSLAEFLRLYEQSEYARPILREGEEGRAAL